MSSEIYDVVIVGAGPCGLACGIEVHRAGLSYLILDKGSLTESIRRYPQQMTFFSTAENLEIGGIPFPSIQAKPTRVEALHYYRRVAEFFELHIRLHTQVIGLNKKEELFEIQTQEGELFFSRNVVLATGYFDRPRQLGVEGENLPHVSKYYQEAFQYVHSKVVVAGAGNSAIEAALELQRHNVEVTMLVRKAEFKAGVKYWLVPNIKNRITEGKIRVIFHAQVAKIEPKSVWYRQEGHQEAKELPADFVLLLVGYVPEVDLLVQAGAEVNPDNLIPVYDKESFETTVRGLFVAGTIVCGIHTEKIFIENGRYDGQKIVKRILENQKQTKEHHSA